jgi:hypothetical protein
VTPRWSRSLQKWDVQPTTTVVDTIARTSRSGEAEQRGGHLSIRIAPLSLDGLEALPAHVRRCVFWEMDPTIAAATREFSDPTFEKEAWLSMVMLEWGCCGQVAMMGSQPAGCAVYAPPSAVPRSTLFPTSPASPDAVLLTTLRVEPRYEHMLLADDLVNAVVSDLVRRGVRALEAFGYQRPIDPEPDDSPAATRSLDCRPRNCMIDAGFLEQVGFKVVAPHHRFPRLRLELEHNHDWKHDVERALDQLLATASVTAEHMKMFVA